MKGLKANRALSIGLIGVLLGFPQISETIYTPSLPDLARGLNIADDWAEFTLSIYFVGFALGVFIWGVISDWIGRRSAMMLGLFIYVLGSWGCFQSQEISSLLACRFIQACGASVGSVVTQTMIRDLYSGVRCNQIFSIVGGILAFSPALGPFLGGWIDEMGGWRGNFAFLIALGCFVLSYVFLKLPETKPEELKEKTSFGQVALQIIKDFRLIGYAILIGGCNGIIFSYYAEAPFIFIDLLHFTPIQYGLTGIVIAMGSLTASIISHRLNSNLSKHENVILLGCFTMGIASFAMTVLAYSGILVQSSIFGISFMLGFVGLLFLGIGLVIPNALSQSLISYRNSIGTAGAMFGLLYYVIIAGLTFLMGVFHNGTLLPMPIYFLTLVAFMFFALIALIPKQFQKTTFQPQNADY